jgi:hypothetical protein
MLCLKHKIDNLVKDGRVIMCDEMHPPSAEKKDLKLKCQVPLYVTDGSCRFHSTSAGR